MENAKEEENEKDPLKGEDGIRKEKGEGYVQRRRKSAEGEYKKRRNRMRKYENKK